MAAPLTFLYLLLARPVLEEAAFRGLVQEDPGRLWRRRWGPLTAARAGQGTAFPLHAFYNGGHFLLYRP